MPVALAAGSSPYRRRDGGTLSERVSRKPPWPHCWRVLEQEASARLCKASSFLGALPSRAALRHGKASHGPKCSIILQSRGLRQAGALPRVLPTASPPFSWLDARSDTAPLHPFRGARVSTKSVKQKFAFMLGQGRGYLMRGGQRQTLGLINTPARAAQPGAGARDPGPGEGKASETFWQRLQGTLLTSVLKLNAGGQSDID